jgi:hypothetical protein
MIGETQPDSTSLSKNYQVLIQTADCLLTQRETEIASLLASSINSPQPQR